VKPHGNCRWKRKLREVLKVLDTADAGANNIVVSLSPACNVYDVLEIGEYLHQIKQELKESK
jgi:hypothetical protein